MKIKIEYLILIGLIAALAIYLTVRSTDRTLYELPVIAEVSAKEFTKIEITRKGSSITLVKKDENWQLLPQEYPVDPGRVEDILSTLSTLKTTALASESKDYQRYELDDDRKVRVRAWTGDRLRRDFELGKAAPSFRHTFIKLENDHRVFHARDNFRRKFDLDATALQDKAALEVTPASVRSFVISSAAVDTEFSRLESDDDQAAPKWQRADGEPADRAAVEKWLGTLSNLEHQGFADGIGETDLDKPIYTVALKDEGSHTLSIFARRPSDPDRYPAVSSRADFPFYLSGSQAEQIMLKPEELMPKPEDREVTGTEGKASP
jgi:hypothetical protein